MEHVVRQSCKSLHLGEQVMWSWREEEEEEGEGVVQLWSMKHSTTAAYVIKQHLQQNKDQSASSHFCSQLAVCLRIFNLHLYICAYICIT